MWDRLRGKLNLRLIIGLESFNLKENLKLNNSSGTSTSKDVVSSPVYSYLHQFPNKSVSVKSSRTLEL